jgi:hypothetical protein
MGMQEYDVDDINFNSAHGLDFAYPSYLEINN